MNTADDLMALADNYRQDAWTYGELRAAIESALRAEYERGRISMLTIEQDAEPVAWQSPDGSIREDEGQGEPPFDDWKPLYASPPKRKRLTDEQARSILREADWPKSMLSGFVFSKLLLLIRQTERAHGIGDE